MAGLCRLFARRGVRVAPFKAQNMSNQSAVTRDGAEIGRAQYAQAVAAGVEPEASMNLVLLKPTGERASQVVVMGRATGTTDAAAWGGAAPTLLPVVLDALASLRDRYDVVVAEGAGGAAELNLLDRDIVNLPLARAAGLPAVLVADIDRGGVFASAAGTLAVLPDELRSMVRGVVVNRLRGDPGVFARRGVAQLERVCGVPVLGVLPWLEGPLVDEEDLLDLSLTQRVDAALDVAVVRFPFVANVTDLDPLVAEPGVSARFVRAPGELGRPALVVLPGTKRTVADLAWLRATGLADVIAGCGASVLGICGGLQMLGRSITDDGVESGSGTVVGLGRLPVATVFDAEKVVRRTSGMALGCPVDGYELRHGHVQPESLLHRTDDGVAWGTSVHGLFEADSFREAFLCAVAARAGVPWHPGGVRYAEVRKAHHERLADWLEFHLDLDALAAIISSC